MPFQILTFSDDQEVSVDNMNQIMTNDSELLDHLLPMLKQSCVAQNDYGFYVLDFPSLIDPSQASGSGSNGATWTKIWLSGNHMGITFAWPSGIFSAAPFIVGHSTGSQNQWGIIPCSHYAETATGYNQTFRDSGGDAYPINTTFRYTALLLGPRSADPT